MILLHMQRIIDVFDAVHRIDSVAIATQARFTRRIVSFVLCVQIHMIEALCRIHGYFAWR